MTFFKNFRPLRAPLGQPLRLHRASYPCRTGGRGRSCGFAWFLPLALGLDACSCIKGKGCAHHPRPFGARPDGLRSAAASGDALDPAFSYALANQLAQVSRSKDQAYFLKISFL